MLSENPAITLSRLAEPVWREHQQAHERRVRAWTDPHQLRASRGEKHPVHDFLFEYYAFRPARLRRWHPGPDVVLTGDGAREFLAIPGYHEHPGEPGGVSLELAAVSAGRREFLAWLHDLLVAMAARAPFFGCFGLHEWAMVYRLPAEAIRHARLPLRLQPAEIARIVESSALCCSHHDAFRFFTASARPLNRLQPARADVPALEQRGCLHANMDLYKWAFKLAPATPADLTADCFALARDIREVDMRASPYDLRDLGYPAIAIETSTGREAYEQYQRAFAARAEPLRARLINLCARLLAEP